MIFIFDCCSGLCNQMYDINTGISFCIHYKISFTFRYASFRNKNLTSWYDVNFTDLFDTYFLNKIPYYIDLYSLKLKPENTFNYDSKIYLNGLLKDFKINTYDEFMNFLIDTNKFYVVIKQPWCLNKFHFNKIDIYKEIIPCPLLMDAYINLKHYLFPLNEDYNFLHYRYEKDFINFFHLTNNKKIIDIIKELVYKKKLNIYIASTNIHNLLKDENLDDLDIKLIYKDEKDYEELNFEQKGFIDYMFGLNSNEVYGHSKSSFSFLLNKHKNTKNYYDEV